MTTTPFIQHCQMLSVWWLCMFVLVSFQVAKPRTLLTTWVGNTKKYCKYVLLVYCSLVMCDNVSIQVPYWLNAGTLGRYWRRRWQEWMCSHLTATGSSSRRYNSSLLIVSWIKTSPTSAGLWQTEEMDCTTPKTLDMVSDHDVQQKATFDTHNKCQLATVSLGWWYMWLSPLAPIILNLQ